MIDRATKLLLTGILICLVILAARACRTLPVQAGGETLLKVDIVSFGGSPIGAITGARIIRNLSGGR